MFDMIPFEGRKNSLTEKEPFSNLVDRFFNTGLSSFDIGFKADIKEEKDKYILEAELPGVDKDNIEVEINDNVMTIKADKDEVIEEESDNYIRKERSYGAYQRSFRLDNVKEDEIKAEYDNGILAVNLPKKEISEPKRKVIDIE